MTSLLDRAVIWCSACKARWAAYGGNDPLAPHTSNIPHGVAEILDAEDAPGPLVVAGRCGAVWHSQRQVRSCQTPPLGSRFVLGVWFHEALSVRTSIAPTQHQCSRLTSRMVWYYSHRLSGRVLGPKRRRMAVLTRARPRYVSSLSV